MAELTLMCPTKGRGDKLHLMFESLLDMCDDPRNFEILMAWDLEDEETGEWLERCKHIYTALNIRVMGRPHSDNLSEDYFNWMVRAYPDRKLYWAIGDDVRMHTRGWDTGVIADTEAYFSDKPDRIGLCFAQDLHPTDKGDIGYEWGCFPILTREAVECLGWFFPEECITWEADVLMAKIFHDPRVDRLHMIDGVVIDQISYHAYPEVSRDNTALSMRQRHTNPIYKSRLAWYKHNQLGVDTMRVAEGIQNGMAKAEPV